MFLRLFSLILIGLCILKPAPAPSAEPTHHTSAWLFSAVEGVDRLKSVPLGVELRLDPGWKTYWRTPGEAGLAPVFDWSGSENLREARILWPAPIRFTDFDIDNFGYEGTVIFPVDVLPSAEGEPLALSLKLDLLVCNVICVPESHRLSLTVPVGAAKVSADQELLAEAAHKVPLAGGGDFAVRNVWLEADDGGKPWLHVNATAASAPGKHADLFVEHPFFVSFGRPALDYDPASRRLHLRAPVRSAETLETLQKKLGESPLTLTFSDGAHAFEQQAALGGKDTSPLARNLGPLAEERLNPGILLVAFLGGLILNLMPCVLPVLSLKILSVLSHGGKDHRIHRWTVFRNFTASAAGILASFWLMAGALATLKAAGESIGWGIQFQHPGFLLFLIVVLAAFAANLWGLYEIPLPRFIAKNLPARHEHEPTLLGHFMTGAFATLLATPCTAPFLGTAVGFALAREAADIFVVFTFLGLGLAFPYLILAVSPRVFRHMPQPGAWMTAFKKAMAVALALTAIWLVSVLVTVTSQPTLDKGWSPFNETLISPAVAEGRTVVVDITADWCLTCKANKRMVLDQKDVAEALSAPNILRLQADWTQRNEDIAAYLRKYGRYGVPFNIVYGPGAPGGILLSELLSRQEVMRALAEASAE